MMRLALLTWHAMRRLPMSLLVASAAGWLLLAIQSAVPALPPICLSAATTGVDIAAGLSASFTFTAPLTILPSLAAMLVAMMSPLLASPLLHLWRRSLPRRRGRAIALFLLGYAVIWLAAALLLFAIAVALVVMAAALPGGSSLPVAILITAFWQISPAKQASLNQCHRKPPLAAFGLRAEVDALAYGITHGSSCVGTCWALMLLPFVTSGMAHWLLMAAITLLALLERTRAPMAPQWGAAWPRRPDRLDAPARLRENSRRGKVILGHQ
jgi:predicted metal-binding membrane protein